RDELTKNDSGLGSAQAWTILILGEGTGRGGLYVPRGEYREEDAFMLLRCEVQPPAATHSSPDSHQRIVSKPGRKIQGRGPPMGLLRPIESITSKVLQSLEEKNCS
ncbi:hypothetical protein IRJ41_018928, partial [Triplophysa rosa]